MLFSFESNNYFQFFLGLIGFWITIDMCACSDEDLEEIKHKETISDRLFLDLFGRGCLALKKHKALKAIVVIALSVAAAIMV